MLMNMINAETILIMATLRFAFTSLLIRGTYALPTGPVHLWGSHRLCTDFQRSNVSEYPVIRYRL